MDTSTPNLPSINQPNNTGNAKTNPGNGMTFILLTPVDLLTRIDPPDMTCVFEMNTSRSHAPQPMAFRTGAIAAPGPENSENSLAKF